MKTRGVLITGLSKHLPDRKLTNADLEKMVETTDEWIASRTGIKERRIAAPDEPSSSLALKAAQKALLQAKIEPEQIDLIIVATVTPDMFFPSTACLIQAGLGAKRAAAFDIEAACPGFIYACAVGSQFIATGMYDCVLVVGVDTLSKIINWKDRNTCVLFGDGAGAAILRPGPAQDGFLSFVLGADGSGENFLKIPAGGSRYPASADTIANQLHTIHMHGNEVFKFAVRAMPEAALESLDRAGLKADQVDLLIPHQANLRIIEAARKRIGLPPEKIFVNLEKYGNTSAASIPVALTEAVEEGRIKEGSIVVLTAFGAGFTWAACTLRW
ncbi:MAG: beta-ketoacyl-ACP synthase III [Bacillota bacterium]|nr:beta-ketoacyl-ACP synthase III [Bacillota bacterium]